MYVSYVATIEEGLDPVNIITSHDSYSNSQIGYPIMIDHGVRIYIYTEGFVYIVEFVSIHMCWDELE